ncbi:MAG TPA: laminin B domain-containing protein [Verrucomicrobiota bacterium]|nr:laminin B domain-containing protein [Verrucomicrobiota bacterium]
MNRNTFLTLTVITLCTAVAASHGQLARSTFETNSEGWMVVDRVFNSLEITNTRAPIYTNSGGNPDGCIYTGDGDGDFYFRAPAKFLGNQSAAYGCILRFDLISDTADVPANLLYSVILTGGGVTNFASFLPVLQADKWALFPIPIQAGAPWTNAATGVTATETDIRTCLAALESLDIAGEFGTGPDTGGLDNVYLFGPSNVVRWDRKANGQLVACFFWPSNYFWQQDEKWGVLCGKSYMVEPSNWSTPNYPNGTKYHVVLGPEGGGPTVLANAIWPVPNSFHIGKLTIESGGGLVLEDGTTLGATQFDFQDDGDLATTLSGAYLLVDDGGSITKSGGTNAFVIHPNISLMGSNVVVAVTSGTLVLPAGNLGSADLSYYRNGTFNVQPDAVLCLVPTNYGLASFYGQFTGLGGGKVLLCGNLGIGRQGGSVFFDLPEGMFEWTEGSIAGRLGNGYFYNDGVMTLSGPTAKAFNGDVNGSTTFRNRGTVIHTGSGPLQLYGNGSSSYVVLDIQSGSTYDLQSNASITSAGAGAKIYHSGIFRKSGGGTSEVQPAFNWLGGTVEVLNGRLVMRYGGVLSNAVANVSPGAVLDLTNGIICRSTFSGSGGGTVLLGGISAAANVSFDFAPGTLQWTRGEISSLQQNGDWVISNKGHLTLSGAATKSLSSSSYHDVRFVNAGTLIHGEGGPFSIGLYSSFTNQAGAVYDFQADSGIEYAGYPLPVFTQQGLFQKTQGSGVSSISCVFVNSGTINAQSGTLLFTGGYTQTAGETVLNGGSLAANSGQTIVIQGGMVRGTGNISANLSSGGYLSPGSSVGQIDLTGNYTQTANGKLNIELAGRGVGEVDRLNVSGTATLAGRLNVSLVGGFAPEIGDQFQVLSCTTRSGTFTTLNVPAGINVNYSNNGVFLSVIGIVPVQILNPAVSNELFEFSFGTITGRSYTVQRNDEVNTTNWVFQTNFTGNGSLMQFAVPASEATQRFFRVRQP